MEYDIIEKAAGLAVMKDLHGGPLRVLADREQIKIAFDNLIADAIQSMDAGAPSLCAPNGRAARWPFPLPAA